MSSGQFPGLQFAENTSAAVRGRLDRPDVLSELDRGLGVVVLVAQVRVLVLRGRVDVQVRVHRRIDRLAFEQVGQGDLPARLLRQPFIVVARDKVDALIEPRGERLDEFLQLFQAGHVGLFAVFGPGGEPGVQRVLVGRNHVAAEHDLPDAVPHTREQSKAQDTRVMIRDFDVRDQDDVVGLDDGELVVEGRVALWDSGGDKDWLWRSLWPYADKLYQPRL